MKNLISRDNATIAALADRLKKAKGHAESSAFSAYLYVPRWVVLLPRSRNYWVGQRPRCMSFTHALPRRVKRYSI